jgi:hypothetical protein
MEISRIYNVAYQTISDIVRNKSRKQQEGPVGDYTKRRNTRKRERDAQGRFL